MIIKRKNLDILGQLEEISQDACNKYPNQKGVGIEVVYRPQTRLPIRGEVFLGWDDIDYLHVDFRKDGTIQNSDDPREFFSEYTLRERLVEVIDEILGENHPNTKEKLGYIKKELQNLKNLSKKID